jgi:hypothetical protein
LVATIPKAPVSPTMVIVPADVEVDAVDAVGRRDVRRQVVDLHEFDRIRRHHAAGDVAGAGQDRPGRQAGRVRLAGGPERQEDRSQRGSAQQRVTPRLIPGARNARTACRRPTTNARINFDHLEFCPRPSMPAALDSTRHYVTASSRTAATKYASGQTLTTVENSTCV